MLKLAAPSTCATVLQCLSQRLPTIGAFKAFKPCSVSGIGRQHKLTSSPGPKSAAQPTGLHVDSLGPEPAVPLYRRPACYTASLAEVLACKQSASAKVNEVGNSFETADGGPSENELKTELEWLFEDAVEVAVSEDGDHYDWRQLQPQIRAATHRNLSLSSWKVQLRASLEELQRCWEVRLKDRVPIQYVTNTAHWYTYVLSVAPGILIPRPETEIFPELVSQALSSNPELANAPWADLGTGSGAIAISAADVLRRKNKDARMWAVDYSFTAVKYAAYNAQTAGLSDHIQVVHGSWYEPLAHLKGQLGGILSNPPYIPRVQMFGLQAEVGRHEPWSALDGGEGAGLDSLKVICDGAVEYLKPGGFIALETAGREQAYTVADMLRCIQSDMGLSGQVAAFQDVRVLDDCYGVPRFVAAYRA